MQCLFAIVKRQRVLTVPGWGFHIEVDTFSLKCQAVWRKPSRRPRTPANCSNVSGSHTIRRIVNRWPADCLLNCRVPLKASDLIPHTATSTVGGFDSSGIETGDSVYIYTFHPTVKVARRVES